MVLGGNGMPEEEITESATVDFIGEKRFRAKDGRGNTVLMEASPRVGGGGNGTTPLELFLASLGSCIGVNTMVVLQEMGKGCESFHADVTGFRRGSIPRLFKRIDVRIRVGGDLQERELREALGTVIGKRCPLSVLVGSAVKLTWDFVLVPKGEGTSRSS